MSWSAGGGVTVPDLSVVVVAHDTRELVRACLRSLYGGGLHGLTAEVLLVDNASEDGTAVMVRGEFPDVRLIRNEANVGFSRANNQAIAVATGRNVLLLNPDTLVPRGALARCVAFLDAQPATAGAMSCRVESPDGSLQHECARGQVTPWSEACRALLLDRLFAGSRVFNPERMARWAREDARPVPAILGAFMLLRRAALGRVGGLDEAFFLMYEDMDLCKRLWDAGFEIWYWPGAHIVHLGGQSTRQKPIMTYANSQVSALQYCAKHYPRSTRPLRLVMRLGMELKIGLLRLNALRRPGDEYTRGHLRMARAARRTLRTGRLLDAPTGNADTAGATAL